MEGAWFRAPAIAGDRVVFTVDDDLWVVDVAGGVPRRLTDGPGVALGAVFSPDAEHVAFTSTVEGTSDVWVVPTDGGEPERLTWFADDAAVQAWAPDGRILISSASGQPFPRDVHLWAVERGGQPVRLDWGRANQVAWRADGVVAIGRHTDDLARWQRYRGGRAGRIWVRDGDRWRSVDAHGGNLASPLWIGDRLGAVCDFEGHAALYAIEPTPELLASHAPWPVRFARSDGRRVVYVAGGELYLWEDGRTRPIPVRSAVPAAGRTRRFPVAQQFLEHVALHPEGHSLAMVVRGQIFAGGLFEGPLRRIAAPAARYRLPSWLPDGALLLVSDASGEDVLEVHPPIGDSRSLAVDGLGRVVSLECDPAGRRAAVVDHRGVLRIVRVDGTSVEVLHPGERGPVGGIAWSPDGAWLAWSEPLGDGLDGARIRLWSAEDGGITEITDGRYRDVSPSFDPEGGLLYFLSWREFAPIREEIRFDYGFPYGCRPYAVVLRADQPDPFAPVPRPFKTRPREPRIADAVRIDIPGISERIVVFPVAEGRWEEVRGAPGRVVLVRAPVTPEPPQWNELGPPRADATTFVFDLEKLELTALHNRTGRSVAVDRAGTAVAWREGWRLRITPLRADKAQREEIGRTDSNARGGRKSGYFDWARVRLEVDPPGEWRQMVGEAWRLLRDHAWGPAVDGLDFPELRTRYLDKVGAVRTRSELSDLLWCLHGELGASHAYEMGGDHPPNPRVGVGRLGADLSRVEGGWRIDRIARADPGEIARRSPLLAPGVEVVEGDVLVAVDGQALGDRHPNAVIGADRPVELAFRRLGSPDAPPEPVRRAVVKPLADDRDLRYRAWIVANRRFVRERGAGRLGYVHIPDMGPGGYAEFFRDWPVEARREAVIVDVRWNRGGHVSQLLLSTLSQRRIGRSEPRWWPAESWPRSSPGGPMVAVTNEMAGSDGDIFSNAWRALGLGPLLGVRTWGGTIGIWPRHRLVDRTITTQPEFASWFENVGYGLENYGAEPDVLVEDEPGAVGDRQLERAVEIALERIASL